MNGRRDGEARRPIRANPAAATTATNLVLKRLGEYKEFIAIIVTALGGVWLAVDYFVTQERFAKEMINNQCQLIMNIAKLSQQISSNHYTYMTDRTFAQIFPYQQKEAQKTELTMEEAKRMKELQSALDVLKRDTDASAERAKLYDEALQTGNCAKLITFTR